LLDDTFNTKVKFKETLDSISNTNTQVSEFLKVLDSGPERELVLTKNGIVVNMCETGTKYFWNMNDPRTAVTCLAAFGEYEPIETRILRKIARDSSVIVDIGANVGFYTVELAFSMPSNGILFSFEPVEHTNIQLRQNVELNGLENVQVFKLGLSNLESETEIFLPNKSVSSAASLRNLHPQEVVFSEIIKLKTLDSVFESQHIDNCDLIKIDVEGGELQVIQGGKKLIEKYKPTIFAELLRKWSSAFSYHPNEVMRLLSGIGYECFAVSKELRCIQKFQDTDLETNFVFIHKDRMHLRTKWFSYD